jgi:hypothetical protein
VTPGELPGYLAAMRDTAASAAAPAADAMAAAFQDHVQNVTLRQSGTHPPFTRTPAPPGAPPARITGDLSSSVIVRPARGAVTATASAGPTVIYAAVQEYGRVISARNVKYMRWFMDGTWWYRRRVYVPPRPYMRPARTAVIRDGTLRRAASAAFTDRMSAFF